MTVMIQRKIEKELQIFYEPMDKKALLVTGARQVGKTYIIRDFAAKHYKSIVEINFLQDKSAQSLFENAKTSDDMLLRLSAVANAPLIPGETLIFFDEVQVCKEIITAVKFLVEDGSYEYILGIELKIYVPYHEKDINYGAVYENATAQELTAHGFNRYYFNSRKQGELDFLIERNGEVLPIEIKSGKDYTRHAALNTV